MGYKFKPELSFAHDITLILPHSWNKIAKFTYTQYSWNINASDFLLYISLEFSEKQCEF